MNFDEWYAETYHPQFGKDHKEWERIAWNAAIAEAVKIINDNWICASGHPLEPSKWCDMHDINMTDKIRGLVK